MASTVVRSGGPIYDFLMPAEVYSTTKPAAPFRTWIVSLSLLIVASALAADLVHRGSGSWTAGDLIQPEGWDLAFRPPAQFVEVDTHPELFGSVYVFQFTDRLGRLIELSIWRQKVEGASAAKLARFILEKSKSWFGLLLGPPPTRTVGRLGDRDAMEIHDPSIPLVLRVVALESGWGYAVSFRIEGGPIDEALYGLFDMTCRSARLRTSENRK